MGYLTIGELAAQTNISKVTIRYYERRGLLPKAKRRTTGYRLYPETMIGRIRFIKNAKSVGFTLEEVSELFILQENPNVLGQEVKSLTLNKLKLVHEKITSLQKMAHALGALVASCDGKMPVQDCPILEALYNDIPQKSTNREKYHAENQKKCEISIF